MQMLQGYQATALLKSGVDLGVFDALAEGSRSVAELAEACSCAPRGLRILCDALCALGLLLHSDEGGGERYALTPGAAAFLVTSSPTSIAGMAKIFVNQRFWDAAFSLPEAVRQGGTVLDDHAETPEHPFWEDFARSIAGLAAPSSQGLTEILMPWAGTKEQLKILDVACGNGMYGYMLAVRHPGAQVTSQDWPKVLETSRQVAEQFGVTDRVSYLPGSMFDVELGQGYDLALASHVFHHFDEATCVILAQRLRETLVPGGKLAINDFIPAASPAEDPGSHMFSVTMLLWTRQGEAHGLDTYTRVLEQAGFGPPERHDLPGLPTRVLLAERKD